MVASPSGLSAGQLRQASNLKSIARRRKVLTLRGGSSVQDVSSSNETLPFGDQVHNMSPDELIVAMRTSLGTGLSSSEARRRLAQYGQNKLNAPEKKGTWMRVLEQFDDKMVQILLGVAILSAALAATDIHSRDDVTHAFTEPLIILTILILNAWVGIAQARNAEASLEALKQLRQKLPAFSVTVFGSASSLPRILFLVILCIYE